MLNQGGSNDPWGDGSTLDLKPGNDVIVTIFDNERAYTATSGELTLNTALDRVTLNASTATQALFDGNVRHHLASQF